MSQDKLTKSINDILKQLTVSKREHASISEKVNNLTDQVDRVENKINHIITLLEEFIVSDEHEEYPHGIDLEEYESYDPNESWIPDPDAWRGDYEDEDE